MDGELDPDRARGVRSHVAACEMCRSRMDEMARAGRAFDDVRGPRILPPLEESRAQLKSRLRDLAHGDAMNPRGIWPRRWANLREVGYASALILLGVAGIAIGAQYRRAVHHSATSSAGVFAAALPQPNLTPGAVRSVTLADVCRAPEQSARAVPVKLQQEVFQEYRLRNARLTDYEVDFLITPELGGADDIRNLWPEPHYSVKWNSYVKDDLETYLHQRVCSGEMPLSTAQRAIATDWISAYKKYFRTNVPLSEQDIRRRAVLSGPTI